MTRPVSQRNAETLSLPSRYRKTSQYIIQEIAKLATYIKQAQQVVHHADTLRNPSQKTQHFESVQETALQKLVDEVAVPYQALTLLPVVDPIPTGILDVGRQIGVDDLLVDLRPARPWQAEPTDISLESIAGREQLQTPDRQTFVSLSLVNPEWVLFEIISFFGINNEVAE